MFPASNNDSDNKPKILIVGASLAGLVTALKMYRSGLTPRIIEASPHPQSSETSKNNRCNNSPSLLLNPRSLELLEKCGISKKIIESGCKLQNICIYEDGKKRADIKLNNAPHRYNYLISLTKEKVKALLVEQINKYGGKVEYGLRLSNIRIESKGTRVFVIKNAPLNQGKEKEEHYAASDIIIGADGVTSTVRNALGIAFTGYDYPEYWSYYDVETKNIDIENIDIGIYLCPDGIMNFVTKMGKNSFRILSNTDYTKSKEHLTFLHKLEDKYKGDSKSKEHIITNCKYKVINRHTSCYSRGNIYLIGGAAHAHSPFAGIGMNTEINDAFELAGRIIEPQTYGALDEYGKSRQKQAKSMLEQSEMVFKAIRTRGTSQKTLRSYLIFMSTKIPFLRKNIIQKIMGLSEGGNKI